MKTTLVLLETFAAFTLSACRQQPASVNPEANTNEEPLAAFTNSLGMKFVPVPGVDAQFCVHDTRVSDWTAFSQDADYASLIAKHGGNVSESWKQPFAGRKPSYTQSGDDPVVNVSWQDAQAFCEWLSKKEGKTYRLPTDLEWSAAVGLGQERGSTPKERLDNAKDKDEFPWGTTWPPPQSAGNYKKPEGSGDSTFYTDTYAYTSPFTAFKANKFGLHDMSGNVFQWCESAYDWKGPEQNVDRVVRGASWLPSSRGALRSAYRSHDIPGGRSQALGFRCLLNIPTATPNEVPTTAVVLRPPSATPGSPVVHLPTIDAKSNGDGLTGATKEAPFVNTLGMKFVPVPGVNGMFCAHDTRVSDWTAFFSQHVDYASLITKHGGTLSELWNQPFVSLTPSYTQSGDDPVVNVSWQDAQAFCEWLSKKEGKTYRLPTDLEWSAAVGLGQENGSTPLDRSENFQEEFPWGAAWPPPQGAGNYYGSESKHGDQKFPNDGSEYTSPYTAFKANRFGLYSMGGNVWQWCESACNGNDTDKTSRRVARGGSFGDFFKTNLFSGFRENNSPDLRSIHYGFRCVVDIPAEMPK